MNRIGFLGYSSAINNIKEYLRPIDGITISGCYTGYPLDGEMLKSEGFVLFESLNDMLDASDSIVCLAEDKEVMNLVEKIIKYRRHLYIHSFSSCQPDHLRHLVNLANEADVVTQVNMDLVFNNVIRHLAGITSNPQMIEIDLGGYLLKEGEGLVHNSSMISLCILVQQLVKQPIRKLSVQRITVAENNSEALNIRFEFHNGCVSTLMLDGVEDGNRQVLKVYQKQSYIIANVTEPDIEIHHHKDGPRIKVKGDKTDKVVNIEKLALENDRFPALNEFLHAVNQRVPASAGLDTIYENQKIAGQIFERLQMHEILAQ